MTAHRLTFIACLSSFFGLALPLAAQTSPPRLDLAVTFAAQRSLTTGTSQHFWLEGGALELGADVFHGLGIAANVTGLHSGDINTGSNNVPVPVVPGILQTPNTSSISLVTATFGPRYRFYAHHRVSVYAEALFGEANGFYGFYPAPNAAQTNANGFAMHFGGGIDLRLTQHLAVRALDAAYVRTQLPNTDNNTQDDLQLGAGLDFRFGH